MKQGFEFVVVNRNFQENTEVLAMWSKRPTRYLCLFTSTARALDSAGRLAGQGSSTATEVPSDHDKQGQLSHAWAPYKELSPRRTPANPAVYNLRDDPWWRALCAH
jgi:hypothetical protein